MTSPSRGRRNAVASTPEHRPRVVRLTAEQRRTQLHAYWNLVAERGQLLASLQSGINARLLDTSRSPRTEEFISWFADAIRADHDVTRRTAVTLAIAATTVPSLFTNAMTRRGANRA